MNSAPARMVLQWSIPSAESRPIAAFLQGLMVSTSAEPGCLSCRMCTDVGPETAISYVEEWKSEEDLKRQLKSERFAALAELMEHASQQPSIEFIVGDTSRGPEYAEEIRLNVRR
jgi:quinol monooxygenase YgiN